MDSKKSANSDNSATGNKRPSGPAAVTSGGKTLPIAARSTAPTVLGKKETLYRRVDWITMAVVTVVVLLGYLWTLAPDLTLEDSGELAVGSMYAAVPHPPGYPVWTLYTWLFTKLLPFSNMSWRVGVSSAVAAAFAAGIVAMLVSRGSSWMFRSLEAFKDIDRKSDEMIGAVSGFAAGLLIGFNGFIWSQALIVEVYTLAVLSLAAMLATLFRWVWKSDERRYLYLSMFLFGICFCNHQTLIVAAMGIELLVVMIDRKAGRDFLLGNTLIWILLTILHLAGAISTFSDNTALLGIFHAVGLSSAAGFVWLAIQHPKKTEEWLRDGILLGGILFLLYLTAKLAGFPSSGTLVPWLFILIILAGAAGLVWYLRSTRHLDGGMLVVVLGGFGFLAGCLFYFYMPLASSTNPPMNWGYPRTWDGFMHAFTRGQYEKTNPTGDPIMFARQIWVYLSGLKEEFNWANLGIALLPFAFLQSFKSRERGWIIGLSGIYFCLAFLLMYLLNAGVDRQSRELVKVFYTSSHVIMALFVGYGLALICGLILKDYLNHRILLMGGACIAVALNITQVLEAFNEEVNVFFLPRLASLFALGLSTAFLGLLLLWQERARLAPVLALFVLIPVDSVLDHWADNEQRGHLFGFWFGHDMFEPGMDADAPAPKDASGKPLYPPITEHSVLFGGTDPGRFCPTYMIFAESFTPAKHRRNPEFDRRDVYIITQNALADNTYLDYIRAHYFRSAQNDPSFFYTMLNDINSTRRGRTNFLAHLAAPIDRWMYSMGENMERERRAGDSYFKPEHFKDIEAFQTSVRNGTTPLATHLANKLGTDLSSNPRNWVRALNQILEGPSLYTPERFEGIQLSDHLRRFALQNPDSHNRIRLNRMLLEVAYPGQIELSPGGLYPDREIYCPSDTDLKRCFEEYSLDAQRRAAQNQLRPGEVLTQLPNGMVSVGGQAAVMAINALLTKIIFERNPNHEFFIEESFPLDWMYPHLVPFGIIMKIERDPVAALTEDQMERDHAYWRQYSQRFIGDWISYDTSVQEVCEFALRVYKRRDFTDFKGDRKFVRDKKAQQAFSKLRNAIGKSIYYWRGDNTTDPILKERLYKEAEFALKQAFAFCPYSPESAYNYASLLTVFGRFGDAYDVAVTAYEFDKDNESIEGLVRQLEQFKDVTAPMGMAAPESDAQLANLITNLDVAFNTAAAWLQSGRSNEAMVLLERMLQSPSADAEMLIALAQGYAQLARPDKMEVALERYTRLAPDSPEAWFDLAAIQAAQAKAASAASSLRKAFNLSDQRLRTNPASRNLRTQFVSDPRFNPVRTDLEEL